MFFKDTTEQELKAKYRELAKVLHPDIGGDTEQFRAMHEEYVNRIQKNKTKTGKELSDVIEKFMAEKAFKDLELELIGTWLWVGGETFPCKEHLKELGFKWARKKKKWYLTHDQKRKYGKSLSMDKIRDKYGSKSLTRNKLNLPD